MKKKRSKETFEEISKRIQKYKNKKSEEEDYQTYNESLKQYLPDFQKLYINSWAFVDLCVAFRKLTGEYTQENKHNFSVKKNSYDFYCEQQIEGKNELS